MIGRVWTVGVALLLGLSCAAGLRAGHGAVVLRGTLAAAGVTDLEFVADIDSLGQATYSGVKGAEVMAAWGDQLRTQSEFYARAQEAAGTDPPGPLYAILDPVGTWAFARSIARFRYVRDGALVGPVTSPVLLLGEKREYRSDAGAVSARSRAFNARMIQRAGEFFRREVAAAGKGEVDLVEQVLRQYKLVLNGSETLDMVALADRLTMSTYVEWLGKAVVAGFDARKLPGAQLWTRFSAEVKLPELLAAEGRASIRDQVTTSISHEMGHLVHFAAVGPAGVDLGGHTPHLDGGSHTLQTLSNPGFALAEGWALANSMVVLGKPVPVASPGEANRIDYRSTVEVVRRKRNKGLATLAAREVAARRLLPPETPLPVLPFDTDDAAFREGLKAKLLELGMSEEDWSQLLGAENEHPELAHLASVAEYVGDLQARKGELRGRYDFLRSEYAVGSALAALRLRLGRDRSWWILGTMAKHKPKNFAAMIEHFVHDRPELKIELYTALVEITEGILLTEIQLAAVRTYEQRGDPVEVDIDRDGTVPGSNLNTRQPGLFGEASRDLAASPLRWNGGKLVLVGETAAEADRPHGTEGEPRVSEPPGGPFSPGDVVEDVEVPTLDGLRVR